MKIMCSGIGGIGVSAYAVHMHERGHEVYGTDSTPSIVTDDLIRRGISVTFQQDGTAWQPGTTLLVYSEAIPADAPERRRAREEGIEEQSYFQALGVLTQGTDLIAVTGTHGKSSTTAMISMILINAGVDPNVVVGTRIRGMENRNWRTGSSRRWVVEACEYRRSFLYLSPSILVITNTDGDHFDAFKDRSDYLSAFAAMAEKIPVDGHIICHADDPDRHATLAAAQATIHLVETDSSLAVGVPGNHMRRNASLAREVARILGVNDAISNESLARYQGSWRRMEILGRHSSGAIVIDDYAHHPVEIRATLEAIRESHPSSRIIAVFQPHTHDRTVKLWDDFSKAFSAANRVFFLPVYDARPEASSVVANMNDLAKAASEHTEAPVACLRSLESAKCDLEHFGIHQHDVIVVMGAGTNTALAHALVENT